MSVPLSRTLELFQDRLLHGNDEIRAHLSNGGPFLGVYDHAYLARLMEIMADDFPAVHTLLGDHAFAEATRAYIARHPSRARSVRWLGGDFTAWLAGTDPWRDQRVLADMAAFEWALGLAFDAPDAEPIAMNTLAGVPPEAWPVLTFRFHPSLNTFTLGFDVAPFQSRVADESDPDGPPAALGSAQTWAAWRDPESLMVRYRALGEDEAVGLAALTAGGDFAGLCEALATIGTDDDAAMRAATLLRHWVEAGWIVDLAAEGLSW